MLNCLNAMKTDIDFLCDLQETFKLTGNKVGAVISRWPKYLELRQWIISQTPKLDNGDFTMSTRIYWILNGLTDFPKCKTCGNPIYINASAITGYKVDHCSNRCA